MILGRAKSYEFHRCRQKASCSSKPARHTRVSGTSVQISELWWAPSWKILYPYLQRTYASSQEIEKCYPLFQICTSSLANQNLIRKSLHATHPCCKSSCTRCTEDHPYLHYFPPYPEGKGETKKGGQLTKNKKKTGLKQKTRQLT